MKLHIFYVYKHFSRINFIINEGISTYLEGSKELNFKAHIKFLSLDLLVVSKQLESKLDNVPLKMTIEKTDLLSIFKLLETTLSKGHL